MYIIRFSKSIYRALWFDILYTDVICTVHTDQNYIPLFSNVKQFAKSHFDHAHFFATLENIFDQRVKYNRYTGSRQLYLHRLQCKSATVQKFSYAFAKDAYCKEGLEYEYERI